LIRLIWHSSCTVPIGLALTDDNGKFTVDVGAYKGPILVEVNGGSFRDEVSGAQVTLKTPMRALLSSAQTGTNTLAVTPMTHFATRKAERGGALTAAAIDDANARMSAMFGMADIVKTLPIAGGTADQKKYADTCGAISQLANDSKQAGEVLDDALSRVMGKMESELEQNGGFSDDTLNKLNTAVAEFDKSGATASAAAPTGGKIKISIAGTTNVIGAVDLVVSLPDGAEVAADPATGDALAGSVTISGIAAVGTNKLVSAKVTPTSATAPARVSISMTSSLGFGIGECATIEFKMAPGAAFPANAAAFSITGFSARGPGGLQLSGMTAATTSLSAM
jgi:hypothetical protein